MGGRGYFPTLGLVEINNKMNWSALGFKGKGGGLIQIKVKQRTLKRDHTRAEGEA